MHLHASGDKSTAELFCALYLGFNSIASDNWWRKSGSSCKLYNSNLLPRESFKETSDVLISLSCEHDVVIMDGITISQWPPLFNIVIQIQQGREDKVLGEYRIEPGCPGPKPNVLPTKPLHFSCSMESNSDIHLTNV